jgi:putative transposase
VWLYPRFTLSFRDVEDLLAERGLDLSYETIRRWVLKFGPLFAKELRRRRHRPTSQWQLDEMAVLISGRQFWLWRVVDDEVKFLICWCSGGATPGQPRGSCANCSRSTALRPLCG